MSNSAFTPTQIEVTNNVPVNVPVVTAGELYTPTAFGFTFGSNGIEWTRQGELIFIKGRFTTSATSGAASLSLPLNLTARTPGGLDVFCGKWVRSTAATNQDKQGNLYAVNGQSRIYFALDDYTLGQSPLNNMSATSWGGAGEVLSFEFTVAISEWAGSGTTTLATRAVEEYAFNNSSSTSGNSNSFAYGIQGTPFLSYSSGSNLVHSYTVRFQTPIQLTDKIVIEVSPNRSVWHEIPAYALSGGNTISQFGHSTTSYFGMGIRPILNNSTDVDVTFGGAGTNSNLDAWSSFSGWYWRLRKVSSGAAVGFPVSARNIVGDTSGSVVPTGMLGEQVLFTTRSVSAVTPNWVANASPLITLTPGTWILFPQITGIAAAGLTSVLAFLSTDSNSDSTGNLSLENGAFVLAANATVNQSDIPMAMIYLNVTQNTPIYAKARTSGANTTITLKGRAVRIA